MALHRLQQPLVSLFVVWSSFTLQRVGQTNNSINLFSTYKAYLLDSNFFYPHHNLTLAFPNFLSRYDAANLLILYTYFQKSIYRSNHSTNLLKLFNDSQSTLLFAFFLKLSYLWPLNIGTQWSIFISLFTILEFIIAAYGFISLCFFIPLPFILLTHPKYQNSFYLDNSCSSEIYINSDSLHINFFLWYHLINQVPHIVIYIFVSDSRFWVM